MKKRNLAAKERKEHKGKKLVLLSFYVYFAFFSG
jgi:hypothetical protein